MISPKANNREKTGRTFKGVPFFAARKSADRTSMNFAECCLQTSRRCVRELPRFVSEVRRMFTPDEMGAHLEQIERAQSEQDVDVLNEDDPLRESPAAAAERIRQFTLIKELLTATSLVVHDRPAEALRDEAGGLEPQARTSSGSYAPSQWRWNPFSPPMVC